MQKRLCVKQGERQEGDGAIYLRISEHDFRRAEGPAPQVRIQVGARREYAPGEWVIKPVSVS